MENKSENIFNELAKIRVNALDAIKSILKERKIESINLYTYWAEDYVDRYIFFACDDDGYGTALYVDTLTYDKAIDEFILNMKNINDYEFDTWHADDILEANQMAQLLKMIEDIVEVADEEFGGRIAQASEDLDEIDD